MNVLVGVMLFFVTFFSKVICSTEKVDSLPLVNSSVIIELEKDSLKNIQKQESSPLGSHYIIDLYDCDSSLIATVPYVEQILIAAAKAAKATIVGQKFHQFSPQGVSGALILAESHLAIHTWPEYRCCTIDIFTCGTMDNFAAFKVLRAGFKSKRHTLIDLIRGQHYKPLNILTT